MWPWPEYQFVAFDSSFFGDSRPWVATRYCREGLEGMALALALKVLALDLALCFQALALCRVVLLTSLLGGVVHDDANATRELIAKVKEAYFYSASYELLTSKALRYGTC